MKKMITQYDVISVKGRLYPQMQDEEFPMDVYHEYGVAPFQHRKDLDLTLKILKQKYPEFVETADEYMKSNVAHECNMFIMKKIFIRNTVHGCLIFYLKQKKQIDTTWYSVEEYRVMGYLAERLCGIYYLYLKKTGRHQNI